MTAGSCRPAACREIPDELPPRICGPLQDSAAPSRTITDRHRARRRRRARWPHPGRLLYPRSPLLESSPVRNGRSRSSGRPIKKRAASASVRAIISDGTPHTSAARRAATSFRWPPLMDTNGRPVAAALGHRLILKVHPGCARVDHPLHQLEGVQGTAKAGLGVGHDGSEPMGVARVFAGLDLIGARQRRVDGAHHGRNAVGRIQALIGIHLSGEISVGSDLPSRNVNGLRVLPESALRPGCRSECPGQERTAPCATGAIGARLRYGRACVRSEWSRADARRRRLCRDAGCQSIEDRSARSVRVPLRSFCDDTVAGASASDSMKSERKYGRRNTPWRMRKF